MNTAQMIQAFKFGMDKFDSFGLPNFEDDEILLMLNQAQERFVKQRYGDTNTKKFGFEEIQKRTEDIKNIVQPAFLTVSANSPDNINSNAQFVTLPDDYWFSVLERAKIEYLDCLGAVVNDEVYVNTITHEDYSYSIDNPYKKANTGKVLKLTADGQIELIHSSDVTLIGLRIRYVRKPNPITSTDTCELSEHTHQEIVDESIRIGLEGIQSKRINTYISLIQNTNE